MRALGANVYFGGFTLGLLRRGVECLAQVEEWEPGILGAQVLGAAPVIRGFDSPVPRADFVYANPPCSRFSQLSFSMFAGSARTNISEFPCLRNAIKVVRSSGARGLWWETGPLCWSQGDGIVDGAAQALREVWGEPVRTAVIRYDLRQSGVPQRRPRVHVVHAPHWGPGLESAAILHPLRTPPRWPSPVRAGEWLRESTLRSPGRSLTRPWVPGDSSYWLPQTDPLLYWSISQEIGTFKSTMPALVSAADRWFPSIFGRHMVLEEDNRWLDATELGDLMSYPHAAVGECFDRWGGGRTAQLVAKSVSATAAEDVWEDAASRWLSELRGVDFAVSQAGVRSSAPLESCGRTPGGAFKFDSMRAAGVSDRNPPRIEEGPEREEARRKWCRDALRTEVSHFGALHWWLARREHIELSPGLEAWEATRLLVRMFAEEVGFEPNECRSHARTTIHRLEIAGAREIVA